MLVSDKPVYPDVVSNLSPEILKRIRYMVTEPGYDDQELYDLSMAKGFQLVCYVKRCKSTPEERMKLVEFLSIAFGTGHILKEKYVHRTAYRAHKIAI